MSYAANWPRLTTEPALQAYRHLQFRAELEAVVRAELRAESERGKRIRQVFSFTTWLITLMVGAGLGAYWTEIERLVLGFSGQYRTEPSPYCITVSAVLIPEGQGVS